MALLICPIRGENHAVSAICDRFEEKSFSLTHSAGVAITIQGSRPTYVQVISSGVAKNVVNEVNGRTLITHLDYPGALVGATELIALQPHLASVVAVTSLTVIRVPAELFLGCVRSDAAFSWCIHQAISEAAVERGRRITELCCLPAKDRLLTVLRRARPAGDLLEPSAALSHQELAQLINVTPEHLCRLIRQLTIEEALRTQKGWLLPLKAVTLPA